MCFWVKMGWTWEEIYSQVVPNCEKLWCVDCNKHELLGWVLCGVSVQCSQTLPPHNILTSVQLGASAQVSLLTCVEKGSGKFTPSSCFCLHHYALHIGTRKPFFCGLGLTSVGILPLILPPIVFLCFGPFCLFLKWIASLSCSKIFSDPLLSRVCSFSPTHTPSPLWLSQNLEGNLEVHQVWSKCSIVPAWWAISSHFLNIFCAMEHTVYPCSQHFLKVLLHHKCNP